MSITNSQGGTGQRRGLSLLGDLLGTLPGYEGIELDAIEHLPSEADRARYSAKIALMMQQFPEQGRKPTGRQRRRALLDILETFASQAPVSVAVPPIVWKYLHLAGAKICARDADWDSAKGPLIAASNDHLRRVLGWNAARTNIAKLAEYGFAVPYCLAGNGKRYLGGDGDGGTEDASGWSLGPLLLLETYISQLAEREDGLRRQHVEFPRRIKRATSAAYRIVRAFEQEEARGNRRCASTLRPTDPFGIERSGFSWSEAPALFQFIDGLIAIPDRPGLDELHTLARLSQIGQATAARASGRIGTEAAILCVLITAHHLHAGEIRKTPDAYMAALVKRAAIGELNIGHTLFGRREAIYGRRETKSSVRVNTMPRSSH